MSLNDTIKCEIDGSKLKRGNKRTTITTKYNKL